MTESELRALVCRAAEDWLGLRESDGGHLTILAHYNAIETLPRGYRMRAEDPWCAAFVSALGQRLGLTDTLLPECGCEPMIALYRARGLWREDEDFTPRPGDLVFYDWQDPGRGDCRGAADHVGLVLACEGGRLRTIEGNVSDSVAERSLARNGRYLRGFALPDYAAAARRSEDAAPDAPSPSDPSASPERGGGCEAAGGVSPVASPSAPVGTDAPGGSSCHCEPVTDVTGAAIRDPAPDGPQSLPPLEDSPRRGEMSAKRTERGEEEGAEHSEADEGRPAGAMEEEHPAPDEAPAPSSPVGALHEAPAGTAPSPSAPDAVTVVLPLLRPGAAGESVRALQLLLIGRGFPCGVDGADGDFGANTAAALRRFQRSRGLEADAEAGPATWPALLGVN